MWSRAQLKDKAKFSLNRNYWKVVLVSLIFVLVGGGSGNTITLKNNINTTNSNNYIYEMNDTYYYKEKNLSHLEDSLSYSSLIKFGAMAGVLFLFIFLIVFAVILILSIFVLNPIEVGCKRFFFKNLNETAQVKEITFAFDNSYKNVVNVLFFRNLYTALWTLLFIIPGIVKSYEYRMIPYLLAEIPAMPKEKAFSLSKQMMDGQKWDAFVLDLSFLGWRILSAFTFGILDMFYVTPYFNMTDAALYESICYSRNWRAYRGPKTTSNVAPQPDVELKTNTETQDNVTNES